MLLGIAMVSTAVFLFYALFYPLSFVAPEFVFGGPSTALSYLCPPERANALLLNGGTVVSLVIAAPFVEEVLCRGFMLGRLAAKWGRRTAVISSSMVFALLHQDVLGAFVFGVFACLGYFRFQSLAAPIILHAANNLVVYFRRYLVPRAA